MSEQSWVLRGIDPETRERAEAEAARRGMSLADYMTDVVLQRALLEQLTTPTDATENAPTAVDGAEQSPAPPQTDNFLVRHRLESLERRLGLAVGGLDGAVHALDSSMFGLAQRVDDAEALAAHTADALEQTAHDVGASLNALRKRLADAEEQTGALGEAHEAARAEFGARCETIEQHVSAVADSMRVAHGGIAQLQTAQDALKYAVADDFSAFAQELMARLTAGLDEVRAAADAAAEQADAAVAHLIVELRGVRESLEARAAEGQAETRQRMHAAFSEAAERLNALSERITQNEQLTHRSADQLRSQIADVEDAAQTALEETAETLRQAGAALAAEFARANRDTQTALDSVHSDLSNEIADLRERQAGGLARLKQVDSGVAANATDIANLRGLVEQSLAQTERQTQAALTETQTEWASRLASLTARISQVELIAAEADRTLQADIERVEACTLAALEKQAADRVSVAASAESRIEDMRRRLESQSAAHDAFQSGALARLKLLESAMPESAPLNARLDGIENELAGRAIDRGFDERLLRLEARAESNETEHALAAMRGQIAGLAAQVDAAREDPGVLQLVDELRSRISAAAAQAADAGERVHGVARMLGHLGAQHADAMTQTEERLRKLELAAAEPRGLDTEAAVSSIEQRIAAIETRQANAFEAMRADIEAFVADNMRRLETLESAATEPAYDVAADFQALRKRIEERVLGVEQRSVRALEQVADTMAVLERRFNGGEEQISAAKTA
ncbi:MAG TPA: hypothetical protein VEA80_07725 [Vitreimonas sp.]|uniref:hypothetical protein n=1 Tax=Vitreimonas sp. TaxID=3069702 RepID=UPI002D293F17|nr:hypothetical protein [Vitreimonas sp.]HYD87347.1 hypothetical protein [Vitreimonas sp.]